MRARLTQPGPHLNDPLCGEDVGLDLGQIHEAQVQCAIGLGPRGLQLLHSPTQHALDPAVIALQLGGLDLVQQHGGWHWQVKKGLIRAGSQEQNPPSESLPKPGDNRVNLQKPSE